MKIKKNLSDEDMLRGFSETLSFENSIQPQEAANSMIRNNKKIVAVASNVFLPAEIEEKFSKLMLEMRTQLLKDKKTNVEWKVKKENNQIIIYVKEKQ